APFTGAVSIEGPAFARALSHARPLTPGIRSARAAVRPRLGAGGAATGAGGGAMARVKLIQNREDIAPEHYALFDELAALRGRISGPSTVVLHSPGLAGPWNEVGEFLHRKSVVE